MEEQIARLTELITDTEHSVWTNSGITDITPSQVKYIEAIAGLVNPNLTELSKVLNLKKPTVKITLDKLEDNGYITRVKSDSDRRSAHIHLSEKAIIINYLHNAAHKLIIDIIRAKLTNEEVTTLQQLISKITKSWIHKR